MRKTANIADLIATANHQLAYAGTREARRGIAGLLEAVLHDANAYAGYGYLPSELNARAGLIDDYDDTRRFYFSPTTHHRGGNQLRSLYEAARWVIQDERQATAQDAPRPSPVEAIKRARSLSVPDLDPTSAAHWAYVLVLEAEPALLDRAVRARYGMRADDPNTPS